MSFLDDLKKTLGNAADYTAKKTGEVTGTAKLRLDIRAKKSDLAKCYEKLGRAYYKALKNEDALDTTALIAQADKLSEELEALNAELAKLQGCIICPACAAQISDKSLYCPLCGMKLPEKVAEASEEAPTCECEEEAAPAEEPSAAEESKDEEN